MLKATRKVSDSVHFNQNVYIYTSLSKPELSVRVSSDFHNCRLLPGIFQSIMEISDNNEEIELSFDNRNFAPIRKWNEYFGS